MLMVWWYAQYACPFPSLHATQMSGLVSTSRRYYMWLRIVSNIVEPWGLAMGTMKLDSLQARSTFKISFTHNALQCCCIIFMWADLSYWSRHVCGTIFHFATLTTTKFSVKIHITLFISYICISRSRNSLVGIATGYWLNDRGMRVRVPVGTRIFSFQRRLDRLWGSPSLLSIGYRGLFPPRSSGRSVKLTTHLQLVPRLSKCGSIHPLPHTSSWRSA
jgi:hypothetical protein